MLRQKIIKVSVALCAGLICSLTLIPIPAVAQTVNSSDFTVRAIIPDNQIDKSKSYFDLLMKPGESQTLSVDVINNSTQEITVDIALQAASTNRNGLIEYQVKVDPDDTLMYPFDTIASAANEIKVAPDSTQKVDVTVTMPEQQFDGVILGGIVFTRRENNGAASGVSINNQFSYVIGVKLSETDKEILPDFRIKSIEPTLVNYRRAVSVNIHNPVALIIKDANVTASIYKKDETAPLFSINKNGIDMAPNSVYPLPVEWEGNDIDAGEYRLKLKLTWEGKIWEWDQDFTIDAAKAQEINKDALDKTAKASWWARWWWIPVLVIVILLLLWFAFILGRRKRDDEEKKSKE